MRLWQTASTPLHDATLHFTVGDDPTLDLALLPYDCLSSAAHATMLADIGVLSPNDKQALLQALGEAFHLSEKGALPISIEQEDGHTALEQFLTEQAGEAGKKIHTGRSRNDQVMAALRLYCREKLLQLADANGQLVKALLHKASEHQHVPMPGYTHTRQGMPSTMGHYFAAVAEDLLRDGEAVLMALSLGNRSVLGSASGYGVPLPLQREKVAELLGFEGIECNTLHAQNTRGKLEGAVLFALHQLSISLSRFASDLIWWSSEAFGFLKLPDALTTGSSIMPQKRNPDLLELTRAMSASMLARYVEVSNVLHGLPGGYHRDLQKTKAPLMAGINDGLHLLSIMTHAAQEIAVDAPRCEQALTPEIFATDKAYALVRSGTPFREAYRQAKEDAGAVLDAAATLAARNHSGAPTNPYIPTLERELARFVERVQPYHTGAHRARRLLGGL